MNFCFIFWILFGISGSFGQNQTEEAKKDNAIENKTELRAKIDKALLETWTNLNTIRQSNYYETKNLTETYIQLRLDNMFDQIKEAKWRTGNQTTWLQQKKKIFFNVIHFGSESLTIYDQDINRWNKNIESEIEDILKIHLDIFQNHPSRGNDLLNKKLFDIKTDEIMIIRGTKVVLYTMINQVIELFDKKEQEMRKQLRMTRGLIIPLNDVLEAQRHTDRVKMMIKKIINKIIDQIRLVKSSASQIEMRNKKFIESYQQNISSSVKLITGPKFWASNTSDTVKYSTNCYDQFLTSADEFEAEFDNYFMFPGTFLQEHNFKITGIHDNVEYRLDFEISAKYFAQIYEMELNYMVCANASINAVTSSSLQDSSLTSNQKK